MFLILPVILRRQGCRNGSFSSILTLGNNLQCQNEDGRLLGEEQKPIAIQQNGNNGRKLQNSRTADVDDHMGKNEYYPSRSPWKTSKWNVLSGTSDIFNGRKETDKWRYQRHRDHVKRSWHTQNEKAHGQSNWDDHSDQEPYDQVHHRSEQGINKAYRQTAQGIEDEPFDEDETFDQEDQQHCARYPPWGMNKMGEEADRESNRERVYDAKGSSKWHSRELWKNDNRSEKYARANSKASSNKRRSEKQDDHGLDESANERWSAKSRQKRATWQHHPAEWSTRPDRRYQSLNRGRGHQPPADYVQRGGPTWPAPSIAQQRHGHHPSTKRPRKKKAGFIESEAEPDQADADHVLYGLHPVQLAVAAGRRVVHRVYHRQQPGARLAGLLEQCAARGIGTVPLPVSQLDVIARGTGVHQGVCARVSPLQVRPVGELLTLLGYRQLEAAADADHAGIQPVPRVAAVGEHDATCGGGWAVSSSGGPQLDGASAERCTLAGMDDRANPTDVATPTAAGGSADVATGAVADVTSAAVVPAADVTSTATVPAENDTTGYGSETTVPPRASEPHLTSPPKSASEEPVTESLSASGPPAPHPESASGPPAPYFESASGTPAAHSESASGPPEPHSEFAYGPPAPHSESASGPPAPHSESASGPPAPHPESACEESRPRRRVWLLLDQVQDPMNFGSILRSSYFLGVDAVLVPDRNSCPLSPTVSKASAGVLEVFPTYSVPANSCVDLLQLLQAHSWQLLAAHAGGQDSVELQDVCPHSDTLLVVGNEGRGVTPDLARLCSRLAVAPQRHLAHGVESLNVGVATGILLSQLVSVRP